MWYVFGHCVAMLRDFLTALSSIHTRAGWGEEEWCVDILMCNVLPATNHSKYYNPHFRLCPQRLDKIAHGKPEM